MKTTRSLREQGYEDARQGKPIEAYLDVRLKRHTESKRAEYEIGWRGYWQDEMIKQHTRPGKLRTCEGEVIHVLEKKD